MTCEEFRKGQTLPHIVVSPYYLNSLHIGSACQCSVKRLGFLSIFHPKHFKKTSEHKITLLKKKKQA